MESALKSRTTLCSNMERSFIHKHFGRYSLLSPLLPLLLSTRVQNNKRLWRSGATWVWDALRQADDSRVLVFLISDVAVAAAASVDSVYQTVLFVSHPVVDMALCTHTHIHTHTLYMLEMQYVLYFTRIIFHCLNQTSSKIRSSKFLDNRRPWREA